MQNKLRQQLLPGVEILPARISLSDAVGKTISAVIEGRGSDSLLIAFDDQSFVYVYADADLNEDEHGAFVTIWHQKEFGNSFHAFAAMDFDRDDLESIFPKWAVDRWLEKRMDLMTGADESERLEQQRWFDM